MKKMRSMLSLLMLFASTLLFSTCDIFLSSPFPEYLGNIEYEHDFSGIISSFFSEDERLRFELISVVPNGFTTDHLYFLLTPSVDLTDPNAAKPRLLYLNDQGQYQQEVTLPVNGTTNNYSSYSVFSRPFVATQGTLASASRDILAGRVLFDPSNQSIVPPEALQEHGFSGFGLVYGGSNRTAIISETGGSNGSYTLKTRYYSTGWIPGADQVINIVPTSEHKSQNELAESTEAIAYRFRGLIDDSGTIVFLIEHMAEDTLYIFETTSTEFTNYVESGDTTSLRERSSDDGNNSIDVTDSYIYHTDEFIIIRRNSGWFERYDLSGNFLDKVNAERGSGILFAFSIDGDYMYRFDPEIQELQVMKTWW